MTAPEQPTPEGVADTTTTTSATPTASSVRRLLNAAAARLRRLRTRSNANTHQRSTLATDGHRIAVHWPDAAVTVPVFVRSRAGYAVAHEVEGTDRT